MTRKHYRMIAETLLVCAPLRTDGEAWVQWKEIVQEIAYTLARDNPLFDRAQFIQACIPAGQDNPRTWPI